MCGAPRAALFSYEKCAILISSLCVVFRRGGAEKAAGRDQCGLSAAGAGERAKQEDRPGAEDERGAQDQVRKTDSEQSQAHDVGDRR